VKLTLVGGGGFRVPLVYGALLRRESRIPVDEIVLHDLDTDRLDRIGLVLEGQAAEHGHRLPFRATTDVEDAVEGADFVFSALRVGRLEGRAVDEAVPLAHGVLGQETVGPGGICFALRTIPVMVSLAETIARLAPHAWLINFTNPAGMVTEATQQVLGDRAIGICDTPAGLCRRVAAALERPPEALWFDWFGLNHLGWLRGVRDGTREVLPDLLANDVALEAVEEGRLFGAEWLRSIGMIPSEYVYYFDFGTDTVDAIRRGPQSRGAYLLDQQAGFYAASGETPQEALRTWRAARDERDRSYMAEARSAAGVDGTHAEGGEGYEAEATAVVEAIVGDTGALRILNVANRSALPFLDRRAVVEVPCVVDRAGAHPVAVGDDVPDHARALVEAVKAVERATIEAALTGSAALAVKALALHPLVPSVTVARRIFAEYRDRLPDLEARFAWV
jgi:6-phospho-beta-glucosidase